MSPAHPVRGSWGFELASFSDFFENAYDDPSPDRCVAVEVLVVVVVVVDTAAAKNIIVLPKVSGRTPCVKQWHPSLAES